MIILWSMEGEGNSIYMKKEQELNMAKISFTSKIEKDRVGYLEQLTEELSISKAGFTEFALNLMEAYFSIDQLKSEVIVHGPKDHRRKE